MEKYLKGVEMPINIVMVIIIAALVTLSVILLLTNVSGEGNKSIDLELIKSGSCMRFCGGTPSEKITVTVEDKEIKFSEFCLTYYGGECGVVCNCVGPAGN